MRGRRFVAIVTLTLAAIVVSVGGILMVDQGRDSSKDVVGITGYRELVEMANQPRFRANIPSNWTTQEHSMVESKGEWISIRGPLDNERRRFTAIDIYQIEKGQQPEFDSLKAFHEYTKNQESIGETNAVIERDVIVAGSQAMETKIVSRRIPPAHELSDPVVIVKQWIVLFRGPYVFKAVYESREVDFDTYFEAYQKLLSTLSFVS